MTGSRFTANLRAATQPLAKAADKSRMKADWIPQIS